MPKDSTNKEIFSICYAIDVILDNSREQNFTEFNTGRIKNFLNQLYNILAFSDTDSLSSYLKNDLICNTFKNATEKYGTYKYYNSFFIPILLHENYSKFKTAIEIQKHFCPYLDTESIFKNFTYTNYVKGQTNPLNINTMSVFELIFRQKTVENVKEFLNFLIPNYKIPFMIDLHDGFISQPIFVCLSHNSYQYEDKISFLLDHFKNELHGPHFEECIETLLSHDSSSIIIAIDKISPLKKLSKFSIDIDKDINSESREKFISHTLFDVFQKMIHKEYISQLVEYIVNNKIHNSFCNYFTQYSDSILTELNDLYYPRSRSAVSIAINEFKPHIQRLNLLNSVKTIPANYIKTL